MLILFHHFLTIMDQNPVSISSWSCFLNPFSMSTLSWTLKQDKCSSCLMASLTGSCIRSVVLKCIQLTTQSQKNIKLHLANLFLCVFTDCAIVRVQTYIHTGPVARLKKQPVTVHSGEVSWEINTWRRGCQHNQDHWSDHRRCRTRSRMDWHI